MSLETVSSKGQIKRKMKRLRDILILMVIVDVLLVFNTLGIVFSKFAMIFILVEAPLAFLALMVIGYAALHIRDITRVVR